MAHLVKSETPAENKNRWATSWLAFNDAQALFGHPFALDVCAEPVTAKVSRFIIDQDRFNELDPALVVIGQSGSFIYGEKQLIHAIDSLSNGWINGWWCNPPFDRKVEFICKAIKEDFHGRHGMMMLPYEPLTGWWQTYVDGYAAKVYEPNGRYNFYESDGVTKKTGVNFGSVFVLFDRTKKTTPRERFKRGFSEQQAK